MTRRVRSPASLRLGLGRSPCTKRASVGLLITYRRHLCRGAKNAARDATPPADYSWDGCRRTQMQAGRGRWRSLRRIFPIERPDKRCLLSLRTRDVLPTAFNTSTRKESNAFSARARSTKRVVCRLITPTSCETPTVASSLARPTELLESCLLPPTRLQFSGVVIHKPKIPGYRRSLAGKPASLGVIGDAARRRRGNVLSRSGAKRARPG